MIDWGFQSLRLLLWLGGALILFLWRRKTCPKCRGRLKYLRPRGGGVRVQCVMCERVWLKGKGWSLRPADPADGV